MKKLLLTLSFLSVLCSAPVHALNLSWERFAGISWQDYNMLEAVVTADTKSLKKYLLNETLNVNKTYKNNSSLLVISIENLFNAFKENGRYVKQAQAEQEGYRAAQVWFVCTICLNIIKSAATNINHPFVNTVISPIFPAAYLLIRGGKIDYLKKAERIEVIKLLIQDPRVNAHLQTKDTKTAYDILCEFLVSGTKITANEREELNYLLSLVDAKMNQQERLTD